MREKVVICLFVLVSITLSATWNFIKPFYGINIWQAEPTAAMAYGSGFLLSIPIWVGLIAILLIIQKEKASVGAK